MVSVCWLASDIRSGVSLLVNLRYAGNSLVSVCWLASDIRYAGNSLVSVCWLASDQDMLVTLWC